MSETNAIRLLVLDLDGVLTDGTVTILPNGDEARTVHFHDLDAVARVRRERGLIVAILSGEDSPTSRHVAARFGVTHAVFGEKDKAGGLARLAAEHGVSVAEACYVGDSDRDAPALECAGVGLTPANATARARASATHVLSAAGGHGAVAEAVEYLEANHVLPQEDSR